MSVWIKILPDQVYLRSENVFLPESQSLHCTVGSHADIGSGPSISSFFLKSTHLYLYFNNLNVFLTFVAQFFSRNLNLKLAKSPICIKFGESSHSYKLH